MPRKNTTDDKKNKLDLLMMKIEQNKADMKATYDAYDKIMSELQKEEDERVSEFKDLTYELIVQYFGEHISTEEFKEWFIKIMTAERNKGAVDTLRRLEEERVKEINAHEAERVRKFKEKHKKKFENIANSEDLPASESTAS